MGLGLFPLFDPPLEEPGFNSDGKLLASALFTLDSFCIELGIPKLSSFTDNRQPAEPFSLDPDCDLDRLEALMGEWDEWFTPESALPTVELLAERVGSGRFTDLNPRDAQSLAADLREIENALRLAITAGSRFRLEMF
jgi:hypothetical protein